ncbi:MAG TPA: lipid A-modifier LpxR family protein [Steroidobacteraceae bacterium]|nr:lipid A-modifier LpxR family protein [Steroidobacteraceae bacterium]
MSASGSHLLLIALGLAGLLGGSSAAAGERADTVDPGFWRQQSGAIIAIDNDLFAISNRDRDYTGGLSLSLPHLDEAVRWNPRRWLGPLARSRGEEFEFGTLQLQVVAFSPAELERPDVQPDDRPYASLWAVTGARQRVSNDGRHAVFASLTVGALGLRVTETLHRAVHRASDTELPEGYDHQISAGGEPTARLMVARRRLLAGGEIGPGSDVWLTAAGSVGYLTETWLGLSARFGDRGTPWWSSGADLADYAAAPAFGIRALGGERTIDMGVRVTVRAYNAFLEGQFRHSDLRVDRSNIEPVIARAWIGVTVSTLSGMRWFYRLTAQSAELRSGPAARVHYWGSLGFDRSF